MRFPFHNQDYRQVNSEDKLEISDRCIEIVIGDVKNYGNKNNLEFNKGLRKNRQSIEQLVSWLGIFESVDEQIINKFEFYLNLHRKNDWNGFAKFEEDLGIGKFVFKFTFFAPSLAEWDGENFKYISGKEMVEFIWECLNDLNRIESCSRIYDFTSWNEYESYVVFFKRAPSRVTLEDFENHFKTVPVNWFAH